MAYEEISGTGSRELSRSDQIENKGKAQSRRRLRPAGARFGGRARAREGGDWRFSLF